MPRISQFFYAGPCYIMHFEGPQHIYELVNPAYSEYIGYRDILNKPFRETLPELEGEGFNELLDKVYQSGETYTTRALLQQISIDIRCINLH